MTQERVSIVGMGLIGASMAGALRRQSHPVVAFDLSEESMSVALDRGFIDRYAETLPAALDGAEIVVLAVPVLEIVGLLPEIDALAPPTALVLDTGSVKAPVVEVMSGLPHGHRAIGGHPLAGSELSGPRAADASLLVDRPFLLSPAARTSRETITRAEALARTMGARPVIIEPARHDRLLARTSHLPQVLSTVLATCLESDDLDAAGAGLQDMTRLAASDVRMWQDILLSNGGNVAFEVRRYMSHLEDLVRVVEAGDARRIEQLMRTGQQMVERLRESVPA